MPNRTSGTSAVRADLSWILGAVVAALGLSLAVAFVPSLAPLRDRLLSLPLARVAVVGGALAVVVLLLAFHRLRRTRARAEAHARAKETLRGKVEGVEAAADGVAVVSPGERFVYANRAQARLLGHTSSAALFGRNWRTVFSERELRRLDRDVLPVLREKGRWVGEVSAEAQDGSEICLDLSLTAMHGGGMTWVSREAEWRSSIEEGRREQQERYRALFHAAGSALLLLSPEGDIVEWNREAERLYGAEIGPVGSFLELFVPADQRTAVAAELDAAGGGNGARAFETTAGGEDRAERRHLLWTITRVDGASRAEGGIVAVGQDITERKKAEEALQQQESRYRLLAHNSSDLVALHRPDGQFEYVSPSCEPLLGMAQHELLGKDLYQVSHSDDWKRIQTALVAAAAGRSTRTSYRIRRNSGEYVWFETLLKPIRDEAGELVQLQSASRDISERKAFEEQLTFQALHEPLTGLPNRTLFMDRVNQALARARREESSVVVMFMDLDRFKIVNDSLGHATGDRILAAVARRVRSCIREADTVARLGGDEFGILLEFDVTKREAAAVAERILGQLKPPFHFSGTEVFLSGSIGIATNLPTTETAEDLLRYADVAMYRAKEAGPGTYRVFDPALDSRATRRLEMESALRRALDREELFVVYQPIVSLETGRISGLEALVRWQHPEWGLVGPGDFVPLAEESGLIVPIGGWVLERACAEVKEWERATGRTASLSIGINLSSRQFQDPGLEEVVRAALETSDIDPERLQLEVTESEVIQSAGKIERLKSLGLRVAIDDFGTGYSSLSYLKSLPVDELKVDRSFVHGMGRHTEDEAIVQTVITLAESLGLGVTAEGIETEDQLDRLRELGCDRGQGFFFARPAPLEKMRELLEADPTW